MILPLIFLLFFVSISNAAESDASQTIVVLKGTACAGKTSLLAAMAEQGWHTVDDDTLMYAEMPKIWQGIFPKEYAIIEKYIEPQNRLHAIMWGHIFCTKDLTQMQQIDLKKAITTIRRLSDYPEYQKQYNTYGRIAPLWHAAIRTGLAMGKNIIVDSWYMKPNELVQYQMLGHHICEVVGYCKPLETLARLVTRNKKAYEDNDLTSYRYVRHVACSFYDGFKPWQESDHKVAYALQLGEMSQYFSKALEIIEKSSCLYHNYGSFSRCELTPEALQALQENFYKKFNFDEQHQVIITSEQPCDILLNLGEEHGTPQYIAEQLIHVIFGRKHYPRPLMPIADDFTRC